MRRPNGKGEQAAGQETVATLSETEIEITIKVMEAVLRKHDATVMARTPAYSGALRKLYAMRAEVSRGK